MSSATIVDDLSDAITTIRAAYNSSNDIFDSITDPETRNKLTRLQELLLSVEQRGSALQDKIAVFERQRTEFLELQNYHLVEVSAGAFAYRPKHSEAPDHFACADCFQVCRISILQFSGRTKSGLRTLTCHVCHAIIQTR